MPAEILRWGELYHANRLALERNYEETVRRLRLSPRDRERLTTALDIIYSSRIEYLDELFGAVVRAIDEAGLGADSLIVFTADHGEMLFRSNAPFKWCHGYMLEPEDLSPPLIIRASGLAPGRYEGLTRSIDVLPTLATLAGVPLAPDSATGVDLAPALRGSSPAPELTAFSHTMLVPHAVFLRSREFTLFRSLYRELDAPGMWVAARRGDQFYRLRYRLGEALPPEHFDLSQDAGLAHNLFSAGHPGDVRMRDELVAYKRRLVEAYARGVAGRQGLAAAEEEERLRSLGYIQ